LVGSRGADAVASRRVRHRGARPGQRLRARHQEAVGRGRVALVEGGAGAEGVQAGRRGRVADQGGRGVGQGGGAARGGRGGRRGGRAGGAAGAVRRVGGELGGAFEGGRRAREPVAGARPLGGGLQRAGRRLVGAGRRRGQVPGGAVGTVPQRVRERGVHGQP